MVLKMTCKLAVYLEVNYLDFINFIFSFIIFSLFSYLFTFLENIFFFFSFFFFCDIAGL
jgi:hypothetical protein